MPATVTVACKLPMGLQLQAQRWDTENEPVLGGGYREVKKARWVDGAVFEVRGTAHEIGQAPKAPLVGGYALTPGCPADLWENWLEFNKHSDLVKNRIIFAHAKRASVEGQAKENRAVATGLEPLNPEMKTVKGPRGDRLVPADPRFPRGGANLRETGTGARED
jgi:hypothetical protein